MELATFHNGKKRRHRVDVLVFNNQDEILCFDRGNGRLPMLPGGALDVGETCIQAAHREVMEESGWVITDVTYYPNSREFVFDGVDDCWFTRDGWRQEMNYCVAARAVKFKPTAAYGKHGDDQPFVFMSFDKVLALTEASLDNGIGERFKNIARSRIEVMKSLQNILNGNKPSWLNW